MSKQFPYKKARLVKSTAANGWYVEFSAWDVQRQALRRKRMYAKFDESKPKTEPELRKWAKLMIEALNEALEEGKHFDKSLDTVERLHEEAGQELIIRLTQEKYLNYCRSIKRNTPKELLEKERIINHFFEWCDDKEYYFSYVSQVTQRVAQEYFQHIVDTGVSPKTYNHKRGRLNHFYNLCLQNEWIEGKNPFKNIFRQPTDYGEKNIPFNDKQLAELIPYLQKEHTYLWYFTAFIYYAFMRASEIKRIQIKDLDIYGKKIRIPHDKSKVRKFDIIPMADPLVEIIEKMNIDRYPLNYYLFSINRTPGERQLGKDWQSRHFKPVKEKFGLSDDHTIYAFKHTAVCRWYAHEKDLVRIQRMCRHSTIDMTVRYLKSLGLLIDEYRIDTLPPLEY